MRNLLEHRHGWERLTRRQFGRMALLLTAGTALPFYNESTLAQDIKAIADIPPDTVRLNANENPLGPCPAALSAISKIVPTGGRYHFEQTHAFALGIQPRQRRKRNARVHLRKECGHAGERNARLQ